MEIGGKIKFSFEYYDNSKNCKYCISCWDSEKIKESLGRLKEINAKSYDELSQASRTYHFHQVNWKQSIEQNGFPDKRIKDMPHFQFALLGINYGLARVFGAYSTGTFYIVWFDLNHIICPTKLRNT